MSKCIVFKWNPNKLESQPVLLKYVQNESEEHFQCKLIQKCLLRLLLFLFICRSPAVGFLIP